MNIRKDNFILNGVVYLIAFLGNVVLGDVYKHTFLRQCILCSSKNIMMKKRVLQEICR